MASVEIYAFESDGRAAGKAVGEADIPGGIGLVAEPASRGTADARATRRPRRLSLVIGTPERAPSGDAWHCRVVLADLHRAQTLEGRDSMEALLLAVARARSWLAALNADGLRLCRDRAGLEPLDLP